MRQRSLDFLRIVAPASSRLAEKQLLLAEPVDAPAITTIGKKLLSIVRDDD